MDDIVTMPRRAFDASKVIGELTITDRLIIPLHSGPRTDAGYDGEVHAYRTATSVVIQIYDIDAAAWRSI